MQPKENIPRKIIPEPNNEKKPTTFPIRSLPIIASSELETGLQAAIKRATAEKQEKQAWGTMTTLPTNENDEEHKIRHEKTNLEDIKTTVVVRKSGTGLSWPSYDST